MYIKQRLTIVGVTLVMLLYSGVSKATNKLEEVHHTQHLVKKNNKQESPVRNLELGSLVLYFSEKPDTTLLPTRTTKAGELFFFFPHVDCSAAVLRSAQQQSQGQGYKMVFEKVTIPGSGQELKKGLKLTITFDPALVTVGGPSWYERFERTTNGKPGLYNGIIFRFYNNALRTAIQNHEKPLALLAQNDTKRVLIDYGHGGKDPGAIGATGSQEKELCFLVGEQLAQLLKKKGYNVGLTRSEDTTLGLGERGTIVNSYADGALLVSLHANASSNHHAAGMESFFFDPSLLLRGGTKPESTAHGITELLIEKRCKKSKLLAQCIQQQLVAHLVPNRRQGMALDRKIKPKALTLLMGTVVPAVLVEIGFLSNKEEEEWLKCSKNHEKIALAVYSGIVSYFQKQSSC